MWHVEGRSVGFPNFFVSCPLECCGSRDERPCTKPCLARPFHGSLQILGACLSALDLGTTSTLAQLHTSYHCTWKGRAEKSN